ncbi:MAG: pantetheine-phosphate adenylyltransferase [Tissierellia bacterium]|nr:pantetheine-phosphate adenylyltransferase [Tissierellia bacterium]
MRVIYPGSFDPITKGHLDIIKRIAPKSEKVYVAILNNSTKNYLFSLEERLELIRKSCEDIENIEVVYFDGLLVDFAKKLNCSIIIRGLRAVSDYEMEMQMALVNRSMYKDLETLFMVADGNYSYLSSSIVKEVASYGGDIEQYVPKCVAESLMKKLR